MTVAPTVALFSTDTANDQLFPVHRPRIDNSVILDGVCVTRVKLEDFTRLVQCTCIEGVVIISADCCVSSS